jgi:hypothetical protein
MERAFDERDARSSLEWKERCVARRKRASRKRTDPPGSPIKGGVPPSSSDQASTLSIVGRTVMSRDDHPTPLASPRSATRASCCAEPVVLPHQALEAALAGAAVAPDPSTTWRRRIVTRRRAERATRKMAGKPALCPSFPSLQDKEGPDTVRTLATRHGILIGEGSVHAAGPMRGHGQSRLSDTCSDLRSPNGVRTRVSTLRVFSRPISLPATIPKSAS